MIGDGSLSKLDHVSDTRSRPVGLEHIPENRGTVGIAWAAPGPSLSSELGKASELATAAGRRAALDACGVQFEKHGSEKALAAVVGVFHRKGVDGRTGILKRRHDARYVFGVEFV